MLAASSLSFARKIRGDESNAKKNATEASSCEHASVTYLKPRKPHVTLARSYPTDFRGKERLLAAYSLCQYYRCYVFGVKGENRNE